MLLTKLDFRNSVCDVFHILHSFLSGEGPMTRTQSFKAILFSAFAFALTLVVATDALAQLRTRLGGASGTGSEWSMTIQLADENTVIVNLGNGFFNANASTPPEQTVSCTYNGELALCSFPEVSGTPGIRCNGFAVGRCSAQGNRPGTRTSMMSCPNPTPDSGCRGTVTVSDLNGKFLATFAIGAGLDDINTTQECQSEFPETAALRKSEMGKIVQSCSRDAQWAPTDRIVEQVVRTDLNGEGIVNYTSTTTWVNLFGATCNPNNGFPAGACTNDGGVWIALANPNPAGSAQACVAAAGSLACGQKADGTFGQPPVECRLDSQNQCECRCRRCDPSGSLVNAGAPGLGKFVLSGPAVDQTGTPSWAAACDVTVTGN